MAKQVINIGRTANDRSGDPLRLAFDKINQNFTELYTLTSEDSISIPGPYTDDAGAATAGVAVGKLYYRSSGQVFVRLS